MGVKTYQRVIDLLRKKVDEAGGSVNAVVRKTGLTHNTVTRYLEGLAEPSKDSLDKIAKAYNVTVSWLRGEIEEDLRKVDGKIIIDITTISPAKQQLWGILTDLPEDKAKVLLQFLKSF